jgi:hypothetical protein
VGPENIGGRQDQNNKGPSWCTGTSLRDAGVAMGQSANLGDAPEEAERVLAIFAGNPPTWGTPTARMAIRSCQGWRTKFMADPMGLWGQV